MSVAFYGAGMLGSAMIRAMLARGEQVRVWNRTPQRALELQAYGATPFSDPLEAAIGVERVHLCLRDDPAVDAVLDAVLEGIGKSSPIVDHTTVLPQRVEERWQRLTEAGYTFAHAPVFMGPPMALECRGVMMTSGDLSLFARLRVALEAMCSDLRYVGERADLAAVYKLMGNAMILAVVGGINDMLRMAEEQGVTRPQAYELFDFYDPTGQVRGRGKRMVENDYDPLWSISMAQKDAMLMQATAHHERLPVIDAMEALLRNVADRGLGDRDLAAVAARS